MRFLAAGWCAPSEVTYSYISDYVVDGILSLPEVSAPRGGLMMTTGPALAQGTFANVDNFGFTQTEAQAIAGTVKDCEVIECPTFTDHRLDAMGYCWKIPLLTQKAYPELIEDAMRLSGALYQWQGLEACLWVSAAFVLAAAALSRGLPQRQPTPGPSPGLAAA